ncbi:hypothetical protein BD311DRAFT_851954 [Dichomitus squalens]|uniref:Uncharacterized protein n=1 Tax=Dichomitus squalens TaxID=114155 RepID=A0A4Q9MEL2_9APHY|nr:hypothetical protein BD311DRAFT_851954 [Dichomitus squalens]
MSCWPDPTQSSYNVSLRINSSSSELNYVGGWTTEGIFKYSELSGDIATFSFMGTSITVFGKVTGPTMQASYGVDESSDSGVLCEVDDLHYRELPFQGPLYTSLPLGPGQHKLLITNKGIDFYFDHLEISNNNTISSSAQSPPLTPSMTTATLTSTAPPYESTATVFVPSTQISSLPNSSSAVAGPTENLPRPKSTLTTGEIVGVAATGWLLLLAVGVGLYWNRVKHGRKARSNSLGSCVEASGRSTESQSAQAMREARDDPISAFAEFHEAPPIYSSIDFHTNPSVGNSQSAPLVQANGAYVPDGTLNNNNSKRNAPSVESLLQQQRAARDTTRPGKNHMEIRMSDGVFREA